MGSAEWREVSVNGGVLPTAAGRAARKPVVTVVIPVFNRANSVLPTLESVRDQTFADWECVVVDDGSEDGEALRTVLTELEDPRFVYARQPNGGGGSARNLGIDRAHGRFIAFLDSDDRFMPRKLERMLSNADSAARLVWYSPVLVDRGEDRYWTRPGRSIRRGEPAAEYLFVSNQLIQTSTLLMPTWLAQEVRFDPSLRKGQDLDFVVRLEALGGARFEMVPEPLTVWTDVTEANRASRTPGHEAPQRWLEGARKLMTERAYHGYRSTVLAYYTARQRPVLALWHLLDGGVRGRVRPTILARQIVRAYVPRQWYRKLVDTAVAFLGRTRDT
jgi:glycosyltransferase involved in cell wall biosynthesis